jgi:tripartite-type tricarboxylate transporter receptor subunit TctC
MRHRRRQFLLAAGSLAGIAVTGAKALAESYPVKPVKIIVGFAAGGPTDVIARLIAQDMSASLGQSFLVENRTGANALIATEAVAHAAPDGYTLLFASLSHNVNKLLDPNAHYDPIKDFAPICTAAALPLLLVTRADAPYDSVQDLVKAAKQTPGALTYGSAGNGGSAHLAGALLETLSGAKMTHVPFRGNAPALAEVMAGRVSFMFYPMIGIADYVTQKRLKVLAIATAERRPDFPSVPTMAEAGFPGFEETAPWVGMLAPAGTPDAIIGELSDAMRASLDKTATKERLKSLGAITVASSPAGFRAFLVRDAERWARVIKAAGVKGE